MQRACKKVETLRTAQTFSFESRFSVLATTAERINNDISLIANIVCIVPRPNRKGSPYSMTTLRDDFVLARG
jgi:hypothetical protein